MNRVAFSEILHEKYYHKSLTVKCFVSGKSISPYTIPRKIKIDCYGESDKKCKGSSCKCHNAIIDLWDNKEDFLKFIDVPESKFISTIKLIFKLSCSFKFKVMEVQNAERIFITAQTGKERIKNSGNYICYSLGLGIDVNTYYELEGVSTVDPFSQLGTCLFYKSTKLKSDIDTFSLTRTINNELNEFIVKKPTIENIFCHLNDLYEYYAHNVTKIYNRFNLHLAVDLVFKSVLSFKFGHDKIHKGWLDAIIIGDTRCGKGYVAEKLVDYFNIGETISGDNLSYSGLIGGIDNFGNHRVISWGKIPINDRGLVVVDEAQEMDIWTKLSRVRSEGVAEIVKIHKQINNARTRLLFLANPLLKSISSYSYGIQSLTDVVKAPEDIARFDYALVVSHDEVTADEINQVRKELSPMYSSTLEQSLIMWIWSRKSSQIIFSDKAIDLTYKKAIEFSKIYSFVIPLIQGENIRIKIAKLAVCFAGRLYSNKDDGKILYVDSIHIECATVFLHLIYKQDSCGYYAMSKLQKTIDIGANKDDLIRVEKYFNAFTNSKPKLMKCLINNNSITSQDLVEQINISRDIGNEIISKLIDLNLIFKKHAGTYIKTPAFNNWLRKKMLGDKREDE